MSYPGQDIENLAAGLWAILSAEPSLAAVDIGCTESQRLWRACELCSYVEHRLGSVLDPRVLDDTAIATLAGRALAPQERLEVPERLTLQRPYWLVESGAWAGTLALRVQDYGLGGPNLWAMSLYVAPEARRRGLASRAVRAVEHAAWALGLGRLRLETDWLWQPAVRFWLEAGCWVQNWKHNLSLVRIPGVPEWRLIGGDGRLELRLTVPGGLGAMAAPHHAPRWVVAGPEPDPDAAPSQQLPPEPLSEPLLWAERDRSDPERLIWGEHPDLDAAWVSPEGGRFALVPTFALLLAMHGWPLVRSPEDWERRYGWSDTGMPEGLAHKIQVFEAYARHLGFRIATPRIPGLAALDWSELR